MQGWGGCDGGARVEVGVITSGFVDVLRPDAGGSKLVYLGGFGFMAH